MFDLNSGKLSLQHTVAGVFVPPTGSFKAHQYCSLCMYHTMIVFIMYMSA